MAPAIECECGFQAQTAHEPATKEEMTGLMDAYAGHIEGNLANAMLNITSGMAHNPGEKGSHPLNMVYHEKTPAKGFDTAEIISGVTNRGYHRNKA